MSGTGQGFALWAAGIDWRWGLLHNIAILMMSAISMHYTGSREASPINQRTDDCKDKESNQLQERGAYEHCTFFEGIFNKVEIGGDLLMGAGLFFAFYAQQETSHVACVRKWGARAARVHVE